jgi:hypothetical protein
VTPFYVTLKPSRYHAAFLLLTHGGALLILPFLHIAWWIYSLISLIVIINFLYLFRRYITRRSKWSTLAMRVESNGCWHLSFRNKQVNKQKVEIGARLKGDSFSSEKLLILNFELEKNKKNISVVIFNDSVDRQTFRHLRTWLNLYKT